MFGAILKQRVSGGRIPWHIQEAIQKAGNEFSEGVLLLLNMIDILKGYYIPTAAIFGTRHPALHVSNSFSVVLLPALHRSQAHIWCLCSSNKAYAGHAKWHQRFLTESASHSTPTCSLSPALLVFIVMRGGLRADGWVGKWTKEWEHGKSEVKEE